MNKKYSTFESFEFYGEFFADPNNQKVKFPGKVNYSTQNGLQLNYNISCPDVSDRCERIFGILDSGQKCTLVTSFDFSTGTHRLGSIHIRNGIHGFYYFLIGDYVFEEDEFEYCHFTFNGMQEFFHPQGRMSNLKFSPQPIQEIRGDDWRINVEHNAKFQYAGLNAANFLHSDNEEVLKELNDLFAEFHIKHPKEYLNIRNELKFHFNYKKEHQQTPSDFISDTIKISSLFSILLNKPVFPDELVLYKNNGKSIHVVNSLCLQSRTVELSKSEISHLLLPINFNKIDLPTALTKWFEVYEYFKVIAVSHQHETNFRTLHTAYSDIILYGTNLEAINSELGGDSSVKYTKPIEYYGSEQLISILDEIFSPYPNKHGLGGNISNLRNELAHVGRPKPMMGKLSIEDYMDIGQVFKLVVVSHLFQKLEIPMSLIHEYQERYLPYRDENS
ncbi:HEPN domain-containing protein [Aliivibrio sifiae]|uniref:ApeA N-terminal domain-containing protein n=1 Tax=Aliivibrio sifiae TaxID=566293 RepID=A0ABQ6ATF8_9GAMM|nr:HEPN domain-containing protein [Aliivibrio sifiae]GLR77249.1 hypothetical protein GCM10007855_41240 [Aliivibrio sifiae]